MNACPKFYLSFNDGSLKINDLFVLLTIFLVATGLIHSYPAAAEQDTVSRPASGMFLVAAPKMRDPRFKQSVILLVEHSSEGSLGFIVNRRTDMTVADAFPELDQQMELKHALYFGGPVQPSRIMFVYSGTDQIEDQKVISGVYWGTSFDNLKDILNRKGEDSLRIFFGYAGWGPGQLEFELSLGDWQVFPASSDYIFSKDTEHLWHLLNRKKTGVITQRLDFQLSPYL